MAYKFNEETDIADYVVDSCNSLMDSFADMLHCLFVTGRRIKIPSRVTIKSFYDDNAHTSLMQWSCLFTSIAAYSSLPGWSNKLIQLVLNTLSTTTDLNDLKIYLSSKVILCTEHKQYDDLAYTVITLERICTQELPFRLEHLACRAITDAMEGRSLSRVSTLGLPKCIEKCVVPNYSDWLLWEDTRMITILYFCNLIGYCAYRIAGVFLFLMKKRILQTIWIMDYVVCIDRRMF